VLIRKTFLLYADDFNVVEQIAQAEGRSVSYKVREIIQQWVESLPANLGYDEMGNDKLKNRN